MHVRQGALPLKFTFLALNIYIFKKSPGNADATYWGLRLRTTGLEEIIYIYNFFHLYVARRELQDPMKLNLLSSWRQIPACSDYRHACIF